ncbi:MAG: DUF302 domain-containing protein [Proteobacteria bacterium]|nr:DUF302 domain-containing protein [Pseudomonadota bacterium]
METNIILYNLEECPECQLVRKKMELLGLSLKIIPVPKIKGERSDLIKTSKQDSVPALIDGKEILTESTEILNYLDKKYGTGQPTPLPAGDYGLRTILKGEFSDVRERTIEAFKKAGFGMLTEIDVKATLKKKIDVDVVPNNILGMCNPKMAHKAMTEEPDVGLLLPCNVVIREEGPNSYHVSAINPVKLFSVVGRDDMISMAREVKEMLSGAMEELSKA